MIEETIGEDKGIITTVEIPILTILTILPKPIRIKNSMEILRGFLIRAKITSELKIIIIRDSITDKI